MSRILRCHPPIPGTAPRAANCLTVGVHPTCHMRMVDRAPIGLRSRSTGVRPVGHTYAGTFR
jgi:hypothetical protein